MYGASVCKTHCLWVTLAVKHGTRANTRTFWHRGRLTMLNAGGAWTFFLKHIQSASKSLGVGGPHLRPMLEMDGYMRCGTGLGKRLMLVVPWQLTGFDWP